MKVYNAHNKKGEQVLIRSSDSSVFDKNGVSLEKRLVEINDFIKDVKENGILAKGSSTVDVLDEAPVDPALGYMWILNK